MSSAGDEFTRLIEIMATLRGPNGCPWDREQTISSLRPYVLEETYEVLEAIDHQDHHALCEELGDFLFEAVFVAQLENALRERGHELERAVLDRRAGGKRRYAILAARTLRAARRFRPDVVYAHFLVPAGLTAALAARAP